MCISSSTVAVSHMSPWRTQNMGKKHDREMKFKFWSTLLNLSLNSPCDQWLPYWIAALELMTNVTHFAVIPEAALEVKVGGSQV
jgi:hypothetical protein